MVHGCEHYCTVLFRIVGLRSINLLYCKVICGIHGNKPLSYSRVLYELHTDKQLHITVRKFSRDSVHNTLMRSEEV